MRAVYRVRQGLANLRAGTGPEDRALVDRYLSPAERALFGRLQPPDQRHSLQVLRSLLAAGARDESLLKAALLHDVGKSRCPIGLVHRTVAVLLFALLGELPAFLVGHARSGWQWPFYVIANHPRIGASMLAGAGCEERVWRLVELHQSDPDSIGSLPDGEWIRESLAALRKADGEN